MKNRAYSMVAQVQLCEYCSESLLGKVFYLFPCSHGFHCQCLVQRCAQLLTPVQVSFFPFCFYLICPYNCLHLGKRSSRCRRAITWFGVQRQRFEHGSSCSCSTRSTTVGMFFAFNNNLFNYMKIIVNYPYFRS